MYQDIELSNLEIKRGLINIQKRVFSATEKSSKTPNPVAGAWLLDAWIFHVTLHPKGKSADCFINGGTLSYMLTLHISLMHGAYLDGPLFFRGPDH